MDSLANYGSDDEYEDNFGDGATVNKADGSQYYSPEEADANYDEVQMDLSEESNNNNSNEEDDRRRITPPRRERSRSRDDPRSSDHRPGDSRSNDQKPSNSRSDDLRTSDRTRRDYRSKYEDDRKYNEDRDRPRKYEEEEKDKPRKYEDDERDKSRKYDDDEREKSRKYDDDERDRSRKYDSRRRSGSSERRSPKYRDDRKEKRRHRRSSSRERKRSPSREKKRSGSRERKRSNSKERKRSTSRERKRSRSPRRSRRSRSKERDGGRYAKKFDRTSNKMAQLEKLGIEIKTPDAEFVTPQMLLQRSMDEQVQKIKNSTGIELPKYYNPAAMNPARYAEQIQKRRLLWQKKETPAATAPVEVKKPNMGKVWESTTFAQDADGKVASKFKRLMGIKESTSEAGNSSKDIMKKQEEMFSSMEQQYEVARTATHTMRGVGLGFGSYQYPR